MFFNFVKHFLKDTSLNLKWALGLLEIQGSFEGVL